MLKTFLVLLVRWRFPSSGRLPELPDQLTVADRHPTLGVITWSNFKPKFNQNISASGPSRPFCSNKLLPLENCTHWSVYSGTAKAKQATKQVEWYCLVPVFFQLKIILLSYIISYNISTYLLDTELVSYSVIPGILISSSTRRVTGGPRVL